MKLLVISHMYPSTFNEVAGIFVHDQVQALISQGCEVKVISPVPWAPFPFSALTKKWKKYAAIPKKIFWDGVEVYYPRFLNFPKGMFFEYEGCLTYWAIHRIVRKIYKEFSFDLIHAHVAIPDGYAAMLLKRDLGKKFVVTIHGQDLFITVNKNKRCKMAILEVFQNAEKIITVSKRLADITQEHDGFKRKVAIIGNGILFRKVFESDQDLTLKYKDNIVILSASYLIPRKGIEYNIKAVRKLVSKYPNIKYLIIGDGEDRARLEVLVTELNLQSHVEFLGLLPHQEVMRYMSMVNIFSLPSWNEAFGVVYIEAMAHGKPIIACEGEGMADIVKHKKTGMLVKPKDVDSLVKAIDYLLENSDIAEEIGKYGRDLVLQEYTWDRNAEKNISLYKEVLSGNESLHAHLGTPSI